MRRTFPILPIAAGLALTLGLCSCTAPESSGAPPVPGRTQTAARPQFTFAPWSQATALIKAGKVLQTVSGSGGFSLILQDHTWVHLVAQPGDPLPRNPKEFIARNAPNAKAIRHTTE